MGRTIDQSGDDLAALLLAEVSDVSEVDISRVRRRMRDRKESYPKIPLEKRVSRWRRAERRLSATYHMLAEGQLPAAEERLWCAREKVEGARQAKDEACSEGSGSRGAEERRKRRGWWRGERNQVELDVFVGSRSGNKATRRPFAVRGTG